MRCPAPSAGRNGPPLTDRAGVLPEGEGDGRDVLEHDDRSAGWIPAKRRGKHAP